MEVLVFNCGSSSLKFDLLELDPQVRSRHTIACGAFEQIGARAKYSFVEGGRRAEGSEPIADHASAAVFALRWIESVVGKLQPRLDAVAHRVVHGGEEIREPVIVDTSVMRALERAGEWAPIHNPAALATIRAVCSRLATVPAVVVADTAFHQTLPAHARHYAIPRELAERHGIRRFGFHGIGHAYMLERYGELTAAPVTKLNLITLHLGAGCSVTAIKEGHSFDTSMGLTPLEGLVMATRSGDLDPAVVTRLAEKERLSPARIEEILNRESGLLAISQLSDDMRELVAAEREGNESAALAIEMFCHRARKYVGAYLATLGWAHAIIFGGGIGEHHDSIRARICAGLEWFGVELDPDRNRSANGREAEISMTGSRIRIYVIPLDEELYMARAAARLISRRR